jgi:hypothetical protein
VDGAVRLLGRRGRISKEVAKKTGDRSSSVLASGRDQKGRVPVQPFHFSSRFTCQ